MSIEPCFPPVVFFEKLRLEGDAVFTGDASYKVSAGAWAFWIPAFRVKILHAIGGQGHCLANSAPPRSQLLAGEYVLPKDAPYTVQDWRDALSKNVLQRAAENFVATQRLHKAGLGPAALGLCVVRCFSAWYTPNGSYSAGIMVEDLNLLPRKWKKATVAQMLNAGVQPDRRFASVRQQIRGYVSDLNSVVGVMPIDAEQETRRLTDVLRELLPDAARH